MFAAVEQRFKPTRKLCEIGFEPLTTPWKAHNRKEWPRHSCERSNTTLSASILHMMRKPSFDAVGMVRPLQPTSPASRAGLSFDA